MAGNDRKKRKLRLRSPSSRREDQASPPSSVKKVKVGIEEGEPYPEHAHPTPQECRSVRDALLHRHGFPKQFDSYRRQRRKKQEGEGASDGDDIGSGSVLDGLISTLLSQNTTDSNSQRAFLSLKSAFPSWQHVVDAEPRMVEDAIRCGGLAATKAARIKSILNTLMELRGGHLSLEYLRGMPVHQVKAELSHFKGIGPKTVACVLMFHLQQEDLPVDTHVFRITKAMGWIPIKADREKAYLHLNNRIPDELKFDLNCLLVTHGKLCDRCVKKRGNSQTRDPCTCPLEYVTDVPPDRK